MALRRTLSRSNLVPFSQRVFQALRLKTFTRAEISLAFDRLDTDKSQTLNRKEIEQFIGPDLAAEFEKRFFHEDSQIVTRETFIDGILKMAEQVDPRVRTLAISMLFTGTAVGLVVPVLPMFVNQGLGLSTSAFGIIIGAFAVTKLTCNVPAAILADRLGRKPLLSSGMALVGVGMGAMSLVSSMEGLIACRMLSGIGVAAFTTGSTLYLADLSTPLNRARTMAPIVAAFSAGSSVGPAIGGVLADFVGPQNCFLITGAGFLSLMLFNNIKLVETLPSALRSRGKLSVAAIEAVKSWGPLLKDPRLRSILVVNGCFWVAFAGAQMTLLPIFLAQQGYSSSHIGTIFAGMSAVAVLGATPSAYVADRFGKVPVICFANVVVAGGMYFLPQAGVNPLLPLALWSVGVTMLGTAPTALVTDVAPDGSRSQAIALFRTVGDVGLLIGAATSGLLADKIGLNTALQVDGGLLVSASLMFGVSSLLRLRRQKN